MELALFHFMQEHFHAFSPVFAILLLYFAEKSRTIRIPNYLFEINNKGQFAVYLHQPDDWTSLLDWSDSPAIRLGETNRLAILAQGSQFLFYINDQLVAECLYTHSYMTDTPDFWRRSEEIYPRHGNRFTGEPSYFKHITSAGKALLNETGYKPADFKWAIFHQPNAKFPINVAKMLGFNMDQINPGLVSPVIGNTYAGSSPLGLASTLDVADPDDRILMVSYGSGSGSDASVFKVREPIKNHRDGPKVKSYIDRKRYIDYATYLRHRGQIIL
jgi:hydroxymethylglutaryl-CoA synthase